MKATCGVRYVNSEGWRKRQQKLRAARNRRSVHGFVLRQRREGANRGGVKLGKGKERGKDRIMNMYPRVYS